MFETLPNSTKLLRHRLAINWSVSAKRLDEGMPPTEIPSNFGIYHPVSTSVTIESSRALQLLQLI